MAILTAHCDDSGDATVSVIAGYVAEVSQWEDFTVAWSGALAREGVRVMHRADLEGFWGEFKRELGWNEERRASFLGALNQIIHQHTLTAIGAAVVIADFRAVVPDWLQRELAGPFGFCAFDCFRMARLWARDHDHHDPIEWIFEAGTRGAGKIGQFMNQAARERAWARDARIERNGWSFRTKKEIPLQSSDLIAYEAFKHTKNQVVDGGVKGVRDTLAALLRKSDERYLRYWDRPHLKVWVQNNLPYFES